jgi:hypothetical protein
MENANTKKVSKCCGASVQIESSRGLIICTNWNVCNRCKQLCDVVDKIYPSDNQKEILEF